jgi:hypothetical protein
MQSCMNEGGTCLHMVCKATSPPYLDVIKLLSEYGGKELLMKTDDVSDKYIYMPGVCVIDIYIYTYRHSAYGMCICAFLVSVRLCH